MKRLSVFLLLLGLVGCKYPSREQAEIACEEWKEKGTNALYIDPNLDVGNKTTIYTRHCNEGEATTQFLGWENTERVRLIKDGKLKEANDVNWKNAEIVKRFRY